MPNHPNRNGFGFYVTQDNQKVAAFIRDQDAYDYAEWAAVRFYKRTIVTNKHAATLRVYNGEGVRV